METSKNHPRLSHLWMSNKKVFYDEIQDAIFVLFRN